MRNVLCAFLVVASPTAPALATPGHAPPAGQGQAARQVHVRITANGFEPSRVYVKKGVATTIVFERVTDATCIKALDIPDENVSHLELPLRQPVAVTITPRKAGLEKFHCSAMGMGDGRIVVED